MIVILKPMIFQVLEKDLIRLNVLELQKETLKGKGRHEYTGYTNNECKIDLTSLTKRECENLLEILDTLKVHGTKMVAADIRKFLRASKDGIGTIRARTCRQASWMLELFFAQLPHHTIFSKDDYGGHSHSGYYVSECDYEPEKPSRNYDRKEPEYTWFGIFHIQNDRRYYDTCKLERSDCQEMTCLEILANKGYVPENPILMEKLRIETERYYKEQEDVGKQCVAVGLGLCDLDNALEEKKSYYQRENKIKLDRFTSTRVVIDVLKESDEDRNNIEGSGKNVDVYRWHKWNMRFHAPNEDELVRHLEADEDTAEPVDVDIPVHPLVPCFDLRRHLRMRIHINNLTPYIYDKSVADRLVLPKRDWNMIELLVDHSSNNFEDIVANKGRSMNVLCAGSPGVGKTASAEVFAEFKKRPLYTIQCAQLGMDAEEVEKNLSVIMDRANRWNAVLLLDEADVYISKRGTDLNQNAIVGAFLRVLEYTSCILFMTTNLGDSVDDAITSRCIAKLNYHPPGPKDQARIWRILTDLNKLDFSDKEIEKVTTKHPNLTGRDVKNLLKLASFVCQANKKPLDAAMIDYVLEFKPTQTIKD